MILNKGDPAPSIGVFTPPYVYAQKEAALKVGLACNDELVVLRSRANCDPAEKWEFGSYGLTVGVILGILIGAKLMK